MRRIWIGLDQTDTKLHYSFYHFLFLCLLVSFSNVVFFGCYVFFVVVVV